jgi:hypothetical protein
VIVAPCASAAIKIVAFSNASIFVIRCMALLTGTPFPFKSFIKRNRSSALNPRGLESLNRTPHLPAAASIVPQFPLARVFAL